MLDSMNLPDKRRYPLPRDLFWYFSSKNAESSVFCCGLQIYEIVKAWYKILTRFFRYFTHKIVSFGQTVCLKVARKGSCFFRCIIFGS